MLDDFGGTETTPETDVSEVLAGLEPVEATSDTAESDLASILEDVPAATEEAQDNLDDVLAGLEPAEQAADAETVDLETVLDQLPVPETGNESVLAADDILSGLSDIDVGDASPEGDTAVDDILSEIEADAPEQDLETPTADDDLDLDDLLSDLDIHEDEPSDGVIAADPDAAGDQIDIREGGDADTISADLDTLLDDLDMSEGPSSDEDASDPILEDLLGDLPDHDAPDGDPEPPHAEDISTTPEDVAVTDATEAAETDLDALLADLDMSEETDSQNDDLDALFGDLEDAAAAEEEDDLADLDALLGDLDEDAEGDLDLDALLAGDAGSETGEEQAAPKQPEPELAYGTMSAQRPEPQKLDRKRFRLAVFGDFTGRAARGLIDTGDALAQRKPMVLDPDTFEDVIESFATELVLPIGKDGAGISVKLGEFDDLHPDELYDNVTLFSELVGLRKQLQSGTTKDHAMKTLAAWAEAHGTPIRAPKARSGGNAVPADRRLSDFQKLIGDTGNRLREASPVEDMLARVVGPHIRALPDPNLGAMQEAVDLALSDAMRLVLHHPEFQSVEAQWRSLDLIQRSVEVDDTLEVMLYDVSAEEIAADLAAQEDLSESGFVRLLTEEPMDAEDGRGAYSALIGLYTFEETPPHAELLGRFARVAAHVDAPFLASVTPAFWDHPKDERPKLVADAWDTLAGMVEAGHLGLLTPRFLLRRPYGAKGEPVDPFDFEEFTQSEGLRGMLWGNPVVLAAILMAKSFKENGASLQLGSIMSLGDMPYHYVTDRFGDQVALPCTERNVDLDKIAVAKERGFMPIAAVRGRDEIRLTSFNSLRGEALLGPWTGEPAPAPSPADLTPPRPEPAPDSAGDDSELDLNFDDDGERGDDDLDALLAGFGDDDDSDLDGDIDADLEALLNDL
ncbi:type VI secretion system contractile sheath domain-containing protein [Epibacterium sp. Ofav1-8]|uniref:type VI secretion system contractile sheath domain-containing protein n=1 Tax=Epibacterium sp. Ofav1-8 TaxID=2917735 RepID=UPI00351D1FF4